MAEHDGDAAIRHQDGVDVYDLLLGHVPEHVERRWALEAAAGRARTGAALEALRKQVIVHSPLGPQRLQLVQFGQLLVLEREPEATRHAQAARRAGASLEELAGVVESGLLTGGIAVYSLGLRILDRLRADGLFDTGSDTAA
ncbi:carboxymuconolactone decarboxylase family protein [Xanthobacter sp. V4C-4]|uniref:carboxymuconolactone decarboxylase family protein n=1 Tax=Xanthobacter cornucopiae TaxID=3119924 RepID=UPI00372BA71F